MLPDKLALTDQIAFRPEDAGRVRMIAPQPLAFRRVWIEPDDSIPDRIRNPVPAAQRVDFDLAGGHHGPTPCGSAACKSA